MSWLLYFQVLPHMKTKKKLLRTLEPQVSLPILSHLDLGIGEKESLFRFYIEILVSKVGYITLFSIKCLYIK